MVDATPDFNEKKQEIIQPVKIHVEDKKESAAPEPAVNKEKPAAEQAYALPDDSIE